MHDEVLWNTFYLNIRTAGVKKNPTKPVLIDQRERWEG